MFPDYQKVVCKENSKTPTVASSDFINKLLNKVASVSIDRKWWSKIRNKPSRL